MPTATAVSVRLTTTSLNRLAATSRRYSVFDTALPAFGVRVEPSGIKTFQLWYRVGGRLRQATLGRFGVLTLDEARKKAREMLVEAGNGSDPLARRDATKTALMVREATTRWLTEQVRPRRKAATVRLYVLALDGHILPKLGARPVT